ncbi:Metastasis-associated protein MTA3 [Nymphon striatum]|nr:Metastasis-associated protein MTA3 [Nymphon striatum]
MYVYFYLSADYVFFETSSTSPFQIRRIEELNKTPNGNVEAKVMCFYRRREISGSLTVLADKHQSALEEEQEDEPDVLSDNQRHQLKHRELFLSRQIETLPATHIRGKCTVTLLNETESLLSYLNKDDTFFYSLVYDPQQKTLLADKGEIRVGPRYQADICPLLSNKQDDDRNLEDLEELVYTPRHELSDRQIDQFLVVARSVGTFARALDCSSSIKQPSLHMSAAAASRDVTLFHAMDVLFQHNYDIASAISSLVPSGGPVLCRDEMEEWSASEANLFEEALEKYGKDFTDIRQDFDEWSEELEAMHSKGEELQPKMPAYLSVVVGSVVQLKEQPLVLPWKTLKNIIEYYYMWKTTDRYVQQKRVKAVEAESKLKQVYIPNYSNKQNAAVVNNSVKPGLMNGTNGTDAHPPSGRPCEGCNTPGSSQWYAWGPAHMQCRLCSSCWNYWKKYGGLKHPARTVEGEKQIIPGKNGEAPFPLPERLAPHIVGHRPHRCSIGNCGKEFKLKAHLARHCANAHGVAIRAGSPRPIMKTRAAFYLSTTALTKQARRACRDYLKPKHAARNPFLPINMAAIKQEWTRMFGTEKANEILQGLIMEQTTKTTTTTPDT